MSQELKDIRDAVSRLEQRLSIAISKGVASSINETTRNTLISSYSDSQKSLDLIHDRMDRISQNYKISIGALFALFFSAGSSAPREIVFISFFFAAAATWQLWQMWIVSCKICRLEALSEIELLSRNDGPANKAFLEFYSNVEPFDKECCSFKTRKRCDRVMIWFLFSVALLGFSIVIYSGNKVRFSTHIQPRDTFLLDLDEPIKCTRIWAWPSTYECTKR